MLKSQDLDDCFLNICEAIDDIAEKYIENNQFFKTIPEKELDDLALRLKPDMEDLFVTRFYLNIVECGLVRVCTLLSA